MADIFLSYSKQDVQQVRLLASALEAEGYSVWWDTNLIGGERYRDVIAAELTKARAAVVIWTANSISSDWVQSEAGRAHRDGKLIPVRAADVEYKDIPPPFDNLHTLTLEKSQEILAAVAGQLAKPATPAPAWKILRYEVLSGLGVAGGAITLATNIEGVLKLSNLFRWLAGNWIALLQLLWQALFFFKFKVSAYDAMLLTIVLLLLSGLFYSSATQTRAQATASVRQIFLPLFLIWTFLLAGFTTIDNRERERSIRSYDSTIERLFAEHSDCKEFMKAFLRNLDNLSLFEIPPERRPTLEDKRKASECAKFADVAERDLHWWAAGRAIYYDQERDQSVWINLLRPIQSDALMIAAALLVLAAPILLPFSFYWLASRVWPLKLNAGVFSRRLWRTIAGVLLIVVVNYVALGIEQVDWKALWPAAS